MARLLRCHLLKLPVELRLDIYRHVFCLPRHAYFAVLDTVSVEFEDVDPRSYQPGWNMAELLCTCRRIYEEAAPMLYSETKFEIDIEAGETDRMERRWTAAKLLATSAEACGTLRLIRDVSLCPCLFDEKRDVVIGRRVVALMHAMNQGRHLKHLKIACKAFRLADERIDDAVFDVFKSVECNSAIEVDTFDVQDDTPSAEKTKELATVTEGYVSIVT
jgi:hypothetical protein